MALRGYKCLRCIPDRTSVVGRHRPELQADATLVLFSEEMLAGNRALETGSKAAMCFLAGSPHSSFVSTEFHWEKDLREKILSDCLWN